MADYYSQKLAGERLRRCYELASPRVQRYLDAEIRHVLTRISGADAVLELGCGYGRVTARLAEVAARAVGVDTAAESIALARRLSGNDPRQSYLEADALALPHSDGEFDAVVCIQNGICAFGVDRQALVREALRVTRPGGLVLLSTYADAFWNHRLSWFEAQAAEGLVGPIDYDATGDGVIVCRDGFRAGRMSPADWESLCERIGVTGHIDEIDGSSVFCEIIK